MNAMNPTATYWPTDNHNSSSETLQHHEDCVCLNRASLHYAAMSGSIDIMEMLLSQGADVDLPDCKGLRPLHYACAEGHTLAVHFLLSKGRSSANMPAIDGITPLHLACAHGHLDIVKLLLQHAADVWITNVERFTALDFAYLYRQPVVLAYLQQWLKSNAPVHKAIPAAPQYRSNSHASSLLFPQGQPLPSWSPLCSTEGIATSSDSTVTTKCEFPFPAASIQLRHNKKEDESSTNFLGGYQLHGPRPVSTLPNFDTIPLDARLDRIRTTRPPSMNVSSSILSTHQNSHSRSPPVFTQPCLSSSHALSLPQFILKDPQSSQTRHQLSANVSNSSAIRTNFTYSNFVQNCDTLTNSGHPLKAQFPTHFMTTHDSKDNSHFLNTCSYRTAQVGHVLATPDVQEEDGELKQNRKDACFAVQARAIRQFAAGNIAFREGDLITVIRQHDNLWWKGYVTAAGIEKAGLFPADTVQLIDPNRTPLPPVQNSLVENSKTLEELSSVESDTSAQRLTPILPRPALNYCGPDGSVEEDDDNATDNDDDEVDECPRSMEEEDADIADNRNHSTSGILSNTLPPSMAPMFRSNNVPTSGTFSHSPHAVSPSISACNKCTTQTTTCFQQQYRHSGASWDSGRGSAYASSVDAVPTVSSVAVTSPLSTFTTSNSVLPQSSSTSMCASVTSAKESNALMNHDYLDSKSNTIPPLQPWLNQRVRLSAANLPCECACHNGNPFTSPSGAWKTHPSEEDINHLIFFLRGIGMMTHLEKIVKAGYDLFTLSRATPEDLTALGFTIPHERTKLKTAFQRGSQIFDPLPTVFPDNLCALLWTLGLSEYEELLHKQGCHNCLSLMELTWEDLEDMGIKRLGHLKKFVLVIERLKRLHNLLENQMDSPFKLSYGKPSPSNQGTLESKGIPTRRSSLRLPDSNHPQNLQTYVAANSSICSDDTESYCSVPVTPAGDQNYAMNFSYVPSNTNMEPMPSQLQHLSVSNSEMPRKQMDNRKDVDFLSNRFQNVFQNSHSTSSLGMLNVISMLEDLEKKLDVHQSLGVHSSFSGNKLSNIQN